MISNMNSFDGVLLASGGMDSTVLAYHLLNQGKKIIPLFINYGQHCADREFERLHKVIPEAMLSNLKVINISEVYSESKSRLIIETNLWEEKITADQLYLDHRNLLFLSIAAAYAGSIKAKSIYAGFIDSNNVKEIDCSSAFFDAYNQMLMNSGNDIIVEFPFRNLTKYDVARLGMKYNVDIQNTFSCQVNSLEPCGACPNCVDRITALSRIFSEDVHG